MRKEEERQNLTSVDGFDGFEERTEGDNQDHAARVIQGEKLQFSIDSKWIGSDEQEIPQGRELVAVDVARVVQKWVNEKPVEGMTRFLAPGEKVPDINALNDACPQSEWSEDLNGKPRGPWQFQYVVYMVDMSTMEKFSYPTGTTGGTICVSDLVDAVRLMRKFRGPGVYPVVSLSQRWMNTRFGGRNRPYFLIRRWISFGPDSTAIAAPTPAPSLQGPGGTCVVQEPTIREETGDDIPF